MHIFRQVGFPEFFKQQNSEQTLSGTRTVFCHATLTAANAWGGFFAQPPALVKWYVVLCSTK